MKTFSICTAMAIFAALSHAAPATRPGTQYVEIRFEGAPPEVAYYTRTFPTDGSFIYIGDPLSISHIRAEGPATCYFYGTDGSVTTVGPYQTVDVGPPQTQFGGYCVQ